MEEEKDASKAKKTLGRVGVDFATGILALTVVDRLMSARKLLADSLGRGSIRRSGLRPCWLTFSRMAVLRLSALTCSTTRVLIRPSRSTRATTGIFLVPRPRLLTIKLPLCIPLALAGLAADIGFVHFHHALEFAGKWVLLSWQAGFDGRETMPTDRCGGQGSAEAGGRIRPSCGSRSNGRLAPTGEA